MGVWSSVQPFSRGPRPVLLDCQRLRSYAEQTVALHVICWVCRNFGPMAPLQSMDVCKHKTCTASRGVGAFVMSWVWRCKQIVIKHSPKGWKKHLCFCVQKMVERCLCLWFHVFAVSFNLWDQYVCALFVCLFMHMYLSRHMCLCVIICMRLCTFCEAPQSLRICGV